MLPLTSYLTSFLLSCPMCLIILPLFNTFSLFISFPVSEPITTPHLHPQIHTNLIGKLMYEREHVIFIFLLSRLPWIFQCQRVYITLAFRSSPHVKLISPSWKIISFQCKNWSNTRVMLSFKDLATSLLFHSVFCFSVHIAHTHMPISTHIFIIFLNFEDWKDGSATTSSCQQA